MDAYRENRELLRFHYHRPQALLVRLEELSLLRKEHHSDMVTIVYSGIDGNMVRIKKEDFSSEEEFLFWKSWSDADYKETDYADSYYHWHMVGLDTIGDSAGTIPSPEEMLLFKEDRDEQVVLFQKKSGQKVLISP